MSLEIEGKPKGHLSLRTTLLGVMFGGAIGAGIGLTLECQNFLDAMQFGMNWTQHNVPALNQHLRHINNELFQGTCTGLQTTLSVRTPYLILQAVGAYYGTSSDFYRSVGRLVQRFTPSQFSRSVVVF